MRSFNVKTAVLVLLWLHTMAAMAQPANQDIPVAPGESYDWRVSVPVGSGTAYGLVEGSIDGYSFEPLTPADCGAVSIQRIGLNWRFSIPVTGSYGDEVSCRYRVTRAADADFLRLSFCQFPLFRPPDCNVPWRLGTFVKRRVSAGAVGRVGHDAATQDFRVTIHNDSALGLASATFSTGCADYGGRHSSFPLLIASDFAGACEVRLFECPSLGGYHTRTYSIIVPPTPAGSSSECQVRLVFGSELARQLVLEADTGSDIVHLADGGTAFDLDGEQRIRLQGLVAPVAVPVGPLSWPALVLLIGAVGYWRLRRRVVSAVH